MAIKRITTNLIKDSDIATVDIANNAITAAKITDGNITTAKLADLSVTAGKLAGTLDLTGKTITVATATTGDSDTSPASTAFVQQEIAALVDSSPSSLNTLNELAAALGDNENFATDVNASIAAKLPLAGGTMTGDLKIVNSSGATLDINSNASAADSKILLHEGTSASPANGASIRYDGVNNLFKIGVGSSVDTTRLTIVRDTGNVGIGNTPNAAFKLDVEGAVRTNGSGFYVSANYSSTNNVYKIYENSNEFRIESQIYGNANTASSPIVFATSNTDGRLARMTINSSGNVGIGGTPDSSGRLLVTNGGTNQIVLKPASGTTNLNMGNFVGGGYISNNYYYSSGHQADDNSKGAFEVFIGDDNYGINYHAAGAAGTRRRDFAINNAGNVGIGTDSPADYDANAAGISSNLVVKDSGHSGIIIISGTGSDAAISFGDGTGAAAYRGAVAYVNSQDALYFKTASSNRMIINSSGHLTPAQQHTYDIGGVNAEVRNIYAQGLYVGGSAAANKLDDYEEGTWTPAASGATLSVAVGTYTKIGNQVTVHYHLYTTGGLPTSTSVVRIQNLPFTSASNMVGAAPIYARYYTPNDSTLTSIIFDGDTFIRLINTNDQSFDYTIWGELEATSNNSVYIIGTATYQV